jgi:hypothetical protein
MNEHFSEDESQKANSSSSSAAHLSNAFDIIQEDHLLSEEAHLYAQPALTQNASPIRQTAP